MAGSYNHAVTSKGKLRTRDFGNAIETMGDAFETVEEMYGMIWWLASELAAEELSYAAKLVEAARQDYKTGIALSPGLQKY